MRRGPYRAGMRHAPFVLTVVVYVLFLGQNWGIYAAALMVASYARHGGRLLEPL